MTDTKFTPGPWTVEVLMDEDPNGDEWPSEVEVGSASGLHICGHDLGYTDEVDACIIANAHLIAAAPDLYAALEDALNALAQFVDTSAKTRKPYEHPLSAYDRGIDALAKARGQA